MVNTKLGRLLKSLRFAAIFVSFQGTKKLKKTVKFATRK